MGLFGLGKKREIIDLNERYKRQQEQKEKIKHDSIQSKQRPSKYENSISSDALNIFANKMASNSSKESDEDNLEYIDTTSGSEIEERKKKLAKRLVDITDKIEDLSNQIYHLQQRIEVIEQKLRVGVGG